MTDAPADWKTALSVMSEAFIAGDNQRGEELLTLALDSGAPWDVATSTVAQALSARRTMTATSPSVLPAPA